MAAAAVEALHREAQVRFHRRSEGGHTTGARAQDHPRRQRHVQPQVQTRQARLPRVSLYKLSGFCSQRKDREKYTKKFTLIFSRAASSVTASPYLPPANEVAGR